MDDLNEQNDIQSVPERQVPAGEHKQLKVVIPIILVVFLVTVLVGGFMVFSQTGRPNESDTSVFPSNNKRDEGAQISGTDMVIMTRAEGVTQRVHDIRRDPSTKALENGTYVFYEGGAAKVRPDFQLIYIEKSHSFAVSLLSAPLHERRLEAEDILLQRLGVSEEVACQLRIMVSTTRNVSATFASQELGLSFCEGSVPLD